MTYLMALLILAGAGLVGLAKYLQRRQQAPARRQEEREDMERSTQQLRHELERSGSEIIGRLGKHVERLETLIAEADRRSDALDARLTELHALSQTMDAQEDALRAAEQEARREQQVASQLLGELRAAAAGAAAVRIPAATAMPSARVDAEDFTSVLRHSIERDEQRTTAPAAYRASSGAIRQAAHLAQALAAEPGEMSQAPAQPEEAPASAQDVGNGAGAGEDDREDGGASTAHVRALLLAGWSPTDVARETGVGRGAIELMQEMMRRQLAGNES